MFLSIASNIDQAFSGFDYAILKFFHNLLLSYGGFLTPIMKFISFLGMGGLFPIFIGILLLWKKKSRRLGFCVLLSLIIGFILTNLLLKNIIQRARPYADETSDYYQWYVLAGSNKEKDYSFPSGHSSVAMALAIPLFLCLNKKYSWIFLLFPVLMGCSRLYLAVHYPSDVIMGFIDGVIGGVISYYAVKRLDKTNWFTSFLNLGCSFK